jgi:hypothetical protein
VAPSPAIPTRKTPGPRGSPRTELSSSGPCAQRRREHRTVPTRLRARHLPRRHPRRARPPALACADDPEPRRAGRPCRPGRRRLLRDPRAPHRRLPVVGRRRRPGRDRCTHEPHPRRVGRHGVELGRSRPRLFQRYSTLDAVSSGRAEVIVGRGSSIDRFRSSATTSPTTKSCSRRRPTSLPS